MSKRIKFAKSEEKINRKTGQKYRVVPRDAESSDVIVPMDEYSARVLPKKRLYNDGKVIEVDGKVYVVKSRPVPTRSKANRISKQGAKRGWDR